MIKPFVTVLLLLSLFDAHSQTSGNRNTAPDDSTCYQQDLTEILRSVFNKPPKAEDDNAGSIFLVPIIGSNPATGFMVGVGGQYAFKSPGSAARYSLISGSVQFTTKKQQIYLLKNSIYTKNNSIFLSGDWRYMKFSQATYGLGTNSPEGGILDYQYGISGFEVSEDSLIQPLEFNFLRFYQTVSFRIINAFYLGIGYYLDSYIKISDEKLSLEAGDSLITSHYAYSDYYDFNPDKYHSSSIGINLITDTRDNMVNPYRGYFAMISWNGSLGLSNNERFNQFFSFEWRSYHSFSQRNPRHLLALWLRGDFVPDGDLPYLALPATAYDQRSRSGRGYTQGRFRGSQLVYSEAEYRFPISKCGGIWGGVLFVNATSANNPLGDLSLLESIKPGYGFGFRMMVDNKSRTNLAIDFGFGEKSFGFYLAASETF